MDWEILLYLLLKDIYKSKLRKILFSRTTFLNYDIKWLIDQYSDEDTINKLVPYTEIVRWLQSSTQATENRVKGIKLCITETKFQLSSNGSSTLRAFQGESLTKFKEAGKMTSNETIIHLEKVEVDVDETRLFIQPAQYADQVSSNLVMDWEGPHTLRKHGNIRTLRTHLKSKYGKQLPPLDEHVLANTIGIGAIILYKDGRHLVPYLPLRVGKKFKELFKKTGRSPKRVAVFEGGYHCTASGAAQWCNGKTFEEMIVNDMYDELLEEVGIEREHIEVMAPVAMCREFLRAGKPEIFFIGITNRSRNELDKLRVDAIQRTLDCGLVPEIHDEVKDYETEAELYSALKKSGFSVESSANLNYVADFIKVYG